MNKKLLNKTTRNFLAFSVLILIVMAPVFYLISHKMYVIETDETLQMHKKDFLLNYNNKFTKADIAVWNKYNPDIKILPSKGIARDTIFQYLKFDKWESEYLPFRELWSPITIEGEKYTYVESINLVEMEGMVWSVAVMFLLTIALLLVGIIWMSKISAKILWKPFYDTLNQIRNFEIDKNKPPQFIPTNIEEFDTLNKSIDRLIEKNTAIYKNQREFIENAAHELQTPLALFQAKIDTMFQLPDISKEHSLVLASLNNDVSRLNRLNKNLLLLSKIENGDTLEKQPLILNDYIKKHLEFFSEQAKAKNLTIITEFSEILTIESNSGFAEVLINNLFLNAIRHNNKEGKIIIVITRESLTFSNTGQGHALAMDKLFNRFSKSNPSSKGNGLGLAIIKKIADLNQWKVIYSFHDDLHEFNIIF